VAATGAQRAWSISAPHLCVIEFRIRGFVQAEGVRPESCPGEEFSSVSFRHGPPSFVEYFPIPLPTLECESRKDSSMSVTMKVVQGKPRGFCLNLADGEFVLGRGTECHIRLDSQLISLQHCMLSICANVIRVRDLGSTNGTLVNGKLLVEKCVLAHGDRLQLGPLVLEISQPEREQEGERSPDAMEREAVADTMDTLVAFDASGNQNTAQDTLDALPTLDVGSCECFGSGLQEPGDRAALRNHHAARPGRGVDRD
jgi:hypothetical protein